MRTSNEVMVSNGAFDQDQLSVVAERQLGAGSTTELDYLHLWQHRPANLGFYFHDVLRLNLAKDLWLLAVK